MQRETGRPARPTVDDLAKHAHIAHAFAQLRSEANKIGAVKATCIAINFAMALHELPDIMNAFPMKMLHEVMRRDFGTHVKKMHALRRGETNDIVERWGFESGYRPPSPHTHPLPQTHTRARARAPLQWSLERTVVVELGGGATTTIRKPSTGTSRLGPRA